MATISNCTTVTTQQEPLQLVFNCNSHSGDVKSSKDIASEDVEKVKKIWEKWSKRRARKPIKLNMYLDYFNNYNFATSQTQSPAKGEYFLAALL